MSAYIRIITALRCEAAPLIQRLHLIPDAPRSDTCLIYRNADAGVFLAVGGVGKDNAANAVAELARRDASDGQSAWLNIGIGGHATRQIGDAVVAKRIEDRATMKAWYPVFTHPSSFAAGTVATVEETETQFRDDCVYEMEAAAFVEAALRHAKAELVHCIKIVSDNLERPPLALTRRAVSELIEPHLDSILAACDQLRQAADSIHARALPGQAAEAYFQRWHFTKTQSHQLRRVLQKLHALEMYIPSDDSVFTACQNSRAVLECLHSRLETYWNQV